MNTMIQYVPEHIQAQTVGVGALSNGAYNFFATFAQHQNTNYMPFYSGMETDATNLAKLEIHAQTIAAQNMAQGK